MERLAASSAALRTIIRWTPVTALTLLLAACATPDRPRAPSGTAAAPPPKPRRPANDTPVKIGQPYQIEGVWYYPRDEAAYDEVGLASWYGAQFHGKPTANGEYFDMEWVTAAHKTLPLPCYVEVTALDTGRTLLVRVNDRGPFVTSRIIDLSRRSAQLLDIEAKGLSRVRVRRVAPAEGEKIALRSGKAAAERPDASPQQLAMLNARFVAPPVVQPPPLLAAAPALAHSPFIQVGAFGDRTRAEALAQALAMFGSGRIVPAGPLWRVRLGPYSDEGAALAALARVQAQGYQDARLVRDSALN